MKDLIVVAGATHRAHLLDEYEVQLAAAGIDFHLWDLNPLPEGIASFTMRRRAEYFIAIGERFQNYKYVIVTDAWDVLFYGNKQVVIDHIYAGRLLVSSERNCFPEGQIAAMIPDGRYANCGMVASSPQYLRAWGEWALRSDTNLDIMDQAWFNRRLAEGSRMFDLDDETALFYVVSADKEGGDLKMFGGRPLNTEFSSRPQFFHFAGPAHPEPFRAMMRGETKSLGGKE